MDLTALKAELDRDEGRRRFAYDDATGRMLHRGDQLRGHLTVGVGWNLSAHGLPDLVIDLLLDIAVDRAVKAVAELLGPEHAPLSEARQRALVNMAFNLGGEGLGKFQRMLTAAKAGRWEDAARAARASQWFLQVRGRAERIVKMLERG